MKRIKSVLVAVAMLAGSLFAIAATPSIAGAAVTTTNYKHFNNAGTMYVDVWVVHDSTAHVTHITKSTFLNSVPYPILLTTSFDMWAVDSSGGLASSFQRPFNVTFQNNDILAMAGSFTGLACMGAVTWDPTGRWASFDITQGVGGAFRAHVGVDTYRTRLQDNGACFGGSVGLEPGTVFGTLPIGYHLWA